VDPIQPPIQWVLGALSPSVKQPECEADHSSRSNAEGMCGAIPPLPEQVFMTWSHSWLSTRTTLTSPLDTYNINHL